jgi:hypothetical protein
MSSAVLGTEDRGEHNTISNVLGTIVGTENQNKVHEIEEVRWTKIKYSKVR